MRFLTSEHAAQAPASGRIARRGFTVLVNLGLGIQTDSYYEETAIGLAGANLGLGGFVKRDLAVMGRFSGTNATQDTGLFSVRQISGVGGATLQYWVNDRFTVEGGAGVGFWMDDTDDSETGFGLILSATTVIFNRGGNNLHLGVEYAPAFIESGTIHNFGITFGYQFHKQ